MAEYIDRYADNWPAKSRRVRQSLGGRCALCWFAKSDQVHHMMYSDRAGPIKGREIPGLHVVPLCGGTDEPGSCHHWVHHPCRWHRSGVWGSRNTSGVILLLQFRYLTLWLICCPLAWVIGGIALLTIGQQSR
jgi:hypothetical protein